MSKSTDNLEEQAEALALKLYTRENGLSMSEQENSEQHLRREGAKLMAMKLLPLLRSAVGAFHDSENRARVSDHETLEKAMRVVFDNELPDQ